MLCRENPIRYRDVGVYRNRLQSPPGKAIGEEDCYSGRAIKGGRGECSRDEARVSEVSADLGYPPPQIRKMDAHCQRCDMCNEERETTERSKRAPGRHGADGD